MARPPADPARQLERAHRVLDAAAGLILRWGYDKTTVDDVARTAGVAKGTIYLHWKTRDLLFVSLLRRERVATLEVVRKAGPTTLRELVRVLVAEIIRRPLMRAVLLADTEVLGKLTRIKRDRPADPGQTEGLAELFGELQAHGALRDDLTVAEHVTVLSSTINGFLLTARLTPEPYRVPEDRLAELIADTAHRAIESDRELPPGDAEAVAAAVGHYIDSAMALARRKLDASLEGAV